MIWVHVLGVDILVFRDVDEPGIQTDEVAARMGEWRGGRGTRPCLLV